MPESPAPDRVATAYHEAGHYLASRLLRPVADGVEIAALSIEPDAASMGRLQIGFDCVAGSTSGLLGFPPAVSRELERELILIFLAGREAQWLGTQKRPVRGHLEDWIEARIRAIRLSHPDAEVEDAARTLAAALDAGDWGKAKQVLSDLSREYPDVRAELDRSREEARTLLMRHRDALDALAAALLDRGRLTPREADAVLAPLVKTR